MSNTRLRELQEELSKTLTELDEKEKEVTRLKEEARQIRLEISRRGGRGF
jgi:peptidoglycan hydrolase CwlO-like protein